jgi:hypothetical protein
MMYVIVVFPAISCLLPFHGKMFGKNADWNLLAKVTVGMISYAVIIMTQVALSVKLRHNAAIHIVDSMTYTRATIQMAHGM